jgi:hypothetical protein
MRRLVLCCLTFSLLTFAATKDRDWKIGKVADATIISREYELRASRAPEIGNLIVVGVDYLYTVQDSRRHDLPLTSVMANREHGCRFIVGDEVKYAQENRDKRHLYVLDADGKECKLDIVRQERREASAK